MRYFSVPADFKSKTIDRYDELNNAYEQSKVKETYGQITIDNFFSSGRTIDLLPRIDIIDLAEYVEYSRRRNIGFNYTINASYMGNKEFTENGIKQIKSFLNQLYKVGIRSLTISLPTLIEVAKSTGYDFEIKASVICQVTNVNKAVEYRRMGADRVVVDESINRDFSTLRRIRQSFGEQVEVIVNSVCHTDCGKRMFHYNQISGDSIEVTSKASTSYYSNRCMVRRYEDIGNIIRLSWIRPEDIKYMVATGINYFKIQGRHNVLRGDPVKAIESYFKESFEGNLLELLDLFSGDGGTRVFVDNKKLDGFIKAFYENGGFCKHDCVNCNYCRTFAEKCIDINEANRIIAISDSYFNGCDPYSELIRTVKTEDNSNKHENSISIDFDI